MFENFGYILVAAVAAMGVFYGGKGVVHGTTKAATKVVQIVKHSKKPPKPGPRQGTGTGHGDQRGHY